MGHGYKSRCGLCCRQEHHGCLGKGSVELVCARVVWMDARGSVGAARSIVGLNRSCTADRLFFQNILATFHMRAEGDVICIVSFKTFFLLVYKYEMNFSLLPILALYMTLLVSLEAVI